MPLPLPWRKGIAQQFLCNSEPKYCCRWLGFKWMGKWNERMFPDVPLHSLHTFLKHLPLFPRGFKYTCSLFPTPPAFNTESVPIPVGIRPVLAGRRMVGRWTTRRKDQPPNEQEKVARSCHATLGLWKPNKAIGSPEIRSWHSSSRERASPHAKLSGTHRQGQTLIVTFENFSSFHIRDEGLNSTTTSPPRP